MAQKITVALEDDLDGGPADETVRFAIGGTEYEIDLRSKNATTFRQQLAPTSPMPVRLGGDSAAGRCGPLPAASAAAASGRGRKTKASRSASAAASPPALLSNTKPLRGNLDPSPESPPSRANPHPDHPCLRPASPGPQ